MRIVGGKFRGKKLCLVGKDSTRETADMVKEAVFNMLGGILDGRVLDLFAGSGAYGLEAYSRGATSIVFVDVDLDAIQTIKKNVSSISAQDHVTINPMTYETYLNRLDPLSRFDYIFLDPPYQMNIYHDILERIEPHLNLGAFVICESKKDVILDDHIHHLVKIKDKTYGIKRISIYQR